jgi:site-specific DNA-methyltransferase (adenine-specific)
MEKLELNTLYNMDCLDGLKRIPARSVKLIIADPPYFQGMTHNGQRGSFVDLAICKPFFKLLFKEFKRILRPDGEVYFFTDWRGQAFYYPLFDAVLGARNLIIWDKVTGSGNFYTFNYEMILFHCVENDAKKKGSNIWRSPGFGGGAKATNGEKVHTTQKTLEIIGKIVRENSQPGDIICDPFAGSGTVSIVCTEAGRPWYAFELDEDNIDIAIKRYAQPAQVKLL